MQVKIQAPGSGKQVILEETNRRISPVGGLSTLAAWFTRIGFMEKLHELMPFRYASHNAIAPAHTFVAFLVSIILGGERFAHVERLRGDEVLKALFGLKRTPGDDTVRNFFKRFTRQRVDAFFMPLQAWLLGLVADCDTALDLDSTVICRHGEKQEGARKGYNPRRPGRLSHHPLLAFLDKPVFMLHGWLRSGNTAAKTGVTEFLKEALAMLPASLRIRTVRADSGFFDRKFFEFLEERGLSYIVVAKLTQTIRNSIISEREWRRISDTIEVADTTADLLYWGKARRLVVVRERIVSEEKKPAGRTLLELPRYTIRVFVTNRMDPPEDIWRDYNGRAAMETQIDSLKDDLAASGFCMLRFYPTEAAFRSAMVLFNLMSLFQKHTMPKVRMTHRTTYLCDKIFRRGALLVEAGRQVLVKIGTSYGGLQDLMPLFRNILQNDPPTSPKLDPMGA